MSRVAMGKNICRLAEWVLAADCGYKNPGSGAHT